MKNARTISRLEAEKALANLGFSFSRTGTAYLAEAISLVSKSDGIIPITELYYDVAKRFNTKAIRVERNIRSAKEDAFQSVSDELLSLFRHDLKIKLYPSNGETIYKIYFYIRNHKAMRA